MKHFPGGFRHMHTKIGRTLIGFAIVLTALLAAVVQPAPVSAQVAEPAQIGGTTETAQAPIDVLVTTLEVGTVFIDEAATTAVVPVTINPGPHAVAAFQFEIVYDTHALTPTGCRHVSGFGVCAPGDEGRLKLNAAHIEGWTSRTNVVEISFDVRASAAVRVGGVDGVWSDQGNAVTEIEYDLSFGAVNRGDTTAPAANQLSGSTLDGDGALTGTASTGVQSSALYGAGVCAIREDNHMSRCSTTNSRGEFLIAGLAAGTYTVEYIDTTTDAGLRELNGVVIESGTTTQGIDFDLSEPSQVPPSPSPSPSSSAAAASPAELAFETPRSAAEIRGRGALTGKITNADGQPVTAVLVCVDEVAIGTHLCAASRFDGTYDIGGLIAGNYLVTVSDPGLRFADETTGLIGFNTGAQKQIDLTLTSR